MSSEASSSTQTALGPQSDSQPGAAASTSVRIVIERPASALARGHYAAPAWAIALLGGALVSVGLVYLYLKLRRVRHR